MLDDFVSHPYAAMSALTRAHVLALRMYTTSSYPRINGPLRLRQRPHPMKMTVYFISDGIKKLRAVAAQVDPRNFGRTMLLWRGMANMTLEGTGFMEMGGSELAPMSTTASRSVAEAYASSEHPLILQARSRASVAPHLER